MQKYAADFLFRFGARIPEAFILNMTLVVRYKIFGSGDVVLEESKPIMSAYFVVSGRICVFQPGCCNCCKLSILKTADSKQINDGKHAQCACVPVFRCVVVLRNALSCLCNQNSSFLLCECDLSATHLSRLTDDSHESRVFRSAGSGFIVGELAMIQGSHRSAHTYTAVGRQDRDIS